ncbi:DNA primase [Citrus sinensis]|nr:DNA primase [Citrus sinensis]
MDDVDRLFQCFKCGISPPPSALRERKRSKNRLKQDCSKQEVASSSGLFSPGSAGNGHKSATDVHFSSEKLGSSTVKAKCSNSGKQISPVVFYGTPHGVPPKRPLSLLRLLREIRVDLSKEDSSNLGKEIWATFPRQNEAIMFAKGHANVRIFSYQDHYNGQRRFLVSTYKEFWQRYKRMDSKFRHHYEVIQEGLPCHLYFDLEFNKRVNPQKHGDEMVDILISVTLEALFDKYSIKGDEDWIVELDSSTEVVLVNYFYHGYSSAEKFSRHLIIRIPKTAFKDNSHAGAFVAEICARIKSAREREAKFESLFVMKDSSSTESESELFVDTAVYSRNRCFRIALSSKAGKKSFLLPSERFKCKGMCEEDMFMASLICNMDADCEKLLVCKMELDCVKTLQFDTEVHDNLGKYCRASQECALSACSSVGKSPFPALDKFVECIASTGNDPGKIRSWYWFSEYGLIVYSMSRNRYCERIGREHKSNHGYRSPLRPIPMDPIPDLPFSSDSEHMVHHGGSSHNNTEYQFVKNYEKHDLLYDDERDTESYCKDSWWIEAVKFANDVENKKMTCELGNLANNDDEDDNWWMVVEQTASHAELMYCS